MAVLLKSAVAAHVFDGVPVGAGAEDGPARLCREAGPLIGRVLAVHPGARVHLVLSAVVHRLWGGDVVCEQDKREGKVKQLFIAASTNEHRGVSCVEI